MPKITEKQTVISDLQRIPGVGISIANDLYGIGIRSVENLKTKDPEKLYDKINKQSGKKHDRCLLYVFRCAVYFSEEQSPKANLLQWWNWSDANIAKREGKI